MNYNNIYINLLKLIKLKGPLYFTLLWIGYQSYLKSKEYIVSTTFKLARKLPIVNNEIEKIKDSMNNTFQKSESTITKLPEKGFNQDHIFQIIDKLPNSKQELEGRIDIRYSLRCKY